MSCPALPVDGGYLSAILAFVDCQAQLLGASGYQALAAPGSTFSLILTALITIFVALFGYRMMLGQVPSVREGVLAFVKIGVVLVLATSWPPYQTLVYDTVFKGPAELTASIGGASGLPGAQGGMVARLEATDRILASLASDGAGYPQTPEQAAQRTPPVLPGFDALALSRIFYLGGVVGAFASVRIIAGLLLALAPFFFAFLLFGATRGLFEGWLRALLGAALGALGVSIVLGIELALLESWLARILAIRAANVSVPNAPVELLVTTGIFALVLAAMLWALARLAMGFRFPEVWQWATNALAPRSAGATAEPRSPGAEASEPAVARSRAIAIADAVAASQRREADGPGNAAQAAMRVPVQAVSRESAAAAAAPLGQTFRRRTINRVSASAGRRDQQ
ncbi:type IV secretion system protein [Sphingomonas sp.]|uniref:type IV secretion system protein n=1 Tax=Sphingomonas sp. TaxID=28214 RepID=UPI0031DC7109